MEDDPNFIRMFAGMLKISLCAAILPNWDFPQKQFVWYILTFAGMVSKVVKGQTDVVLSQMSSNGLRFHIPDSLIIFRKKKQKATFERGDHVIQHYNV